MNCDQLPECFLMVFVPDMGKFVDDHILDRFERYFGKHRVETESVFAAAAPPLSFGFAE
jgi:hypothetical protein